MEEKTPTNDLIDHHRAKLTPEGREVLEELDAAEFTLDRSAEAAALERGKYLPEADKDVIRRVFGLRAREYRAAGEEPQRGEAVADTVLDVFDRAAALLRSEGKEPDEAMTLGEAIEVLRRHGEQP